MASFSELGVMAMKYLLFIFNLVFVLTGISLITVGIIVKSANEEYENVLAQDYITAPNLLIFIGTFIFFVAFFGCCGALKENHCMIFTFSVIMAAIFIAEVAVGVTGYMLKADTTDMLTKGLNSTMYQYNTTWDDTTMWDGLQENLSCCGTKNYTDWIPILKNGTNLPMSCCAPQNGKIGVLTCDVTSPSLQKTPCIDALGNTIRDNSSTIGLTGIIIAVIQLLGVIFSCNLAYSIRNNYESV